MTLDQIRARANNCSTYNFGMWAANKLAHNDVPQLLDALQNILTLADAIDGLDDHLTNKHIPPLIRKTIQDALTKERAP